MASKQSKQTLVSILWRVCVVVVVFLLHETTFFIPISDIMIQQHTLRRFALILHPREIHDTWYRLFMWSQTVL